jgi:SAM-dependent methyltransferase
VSTAPKSASSPWSAPGWVDFYENRRTKTEDIYPSEWFFMKDLLADGMSVLDVGCALGGLASVLSEHLEHFTYTGVDISEAMIARARQKHARHQFHVIGEADLSVLAEDRFDLVVCLGVLHLTRRWRELIAAAWARTEKTFLLDLRETSDASVEDETVSYYRVDALLETAAPARLPYNIINSAEALATLIGQCAGAVGLQHYGYLASVSSAAVTSTKQVLMDTYRIDKRPLRAPFIPTT